MRPIALRCAREATCGLVWMALAATLSLAAEGPVADVVLAVHGGLGSPRSEVDNDEERQLRDGLTRALEAGYAVLRKNEGTSLDAVEASIRVLEDDPAFNAGKGAVFTREGKNELDASIMEGRTKKAGAVAGVTVVKNPISAARAVMDKTKHVMLVGRGAEVFAEESGLEIVEPSYFRTEKRWQQLQKELRREEESKSGPKGAASGQRLSSTRWGTVGAVAVDRSGNLAAGTSTGGMSNKQYGRVGDSPVIGAGTYADNATCAVSCTGHGEFFIRYAVSHDISALIEYKGLSVRDAVHLVIERKLKEAGGEGAAIVLDAKGNFASAHNSDGLFRGWVTRDGSIVVRLFDE